MTFSDSGDVCTEMQRQVEANEMRIEVLEKENLELKRTLSKLAPQPQSHRESEVALSPDFVPPSDDSSTSPGQQEDLYKAPVSAMLFAGC